MAVCFHEKIRAIYGTLLPGAKSFKNPLFKVFFTPVRNPFSDKKIFFEAVAWTDDFETLQDSAVLQCLEREQEKWREKMSGLSDIGALNPG